MTLGRGLVANARNAFPSMQEIAELRPQFIRTIAYGNDDIEACLQEVPPGVKLIVLMNNEHEEVGSDWHGWESAVQSFAYRFQGRVWGLEMTNEWDLHGLPAQFISRLISTASPYLVQVGMKRIVGAVAGPDWQNELTAFWSLANPSDYDYGGIHPYGQLVASMGPPQPGFGPGLAESVQTASRLLGRKPIIVTEFGAKLRDYGGESRQAEYVTRAFAELAALPDPVAPTAACFFAYHDSVGGPDEQGFDAFGLVRADGSRRPAWDAYASLATDPCEGLKLAVRDYVASRKGKSLSKTRILELVA